MGNKFYAVRKGKKTGIYTTWDECKEQVDGYPKAEYKGFKTKEEAENYMSHISNTIIYDNPLNNEVFIYYKLKKKDNFYLLAVELETEKDTYNYISKLNLQYDIYYTRLYAVIAVLELVTSLGYKNIKLFFDDMSVHNYITREWNPLKGKNKEITTDYYNMFIILNQSTLANIGFCALQVNSMAQKRLQGIIKSKVPTTIITLDDIRGQNINCTYFCNV